MIETRNNMVTLASMARLTCNVSRVGFDGTEVVSSQELVPGDLVQIEDHLVLPCDVVLLRGQCVMNECMLTGESIPIIKSPIPENDDTTIYSSDKHKQYTLYSGTSVMQVKPQGDNPVLGVVTQTGFSTAKGKCKYYSNVNTILK